MIKEVQHEIELGELTDYPTDSVLYELGPKTGNFEKEDIERLLAMDAFGPAQAEWVSQIVFDPKKDGTIHFCVNYWKLNAVMIPD